MAEPSAEGDLNPQSSSLQVPQSQENRRSGPNSQTIPEVWSDFDDDSFSEYMSEIPELSPDVVSDARTHQVEPAPQPPKSKVEMKLFARPDSSGFGTASNFTAPRAKSFQVPSLSRSIKADQPCFITQAASSVKGFGLSSGQEQKASHSPSARDAESDDLEGICVLPLSREPNMPSYGSYASKKSRSSRSSSQRHSREEHKYHAGEAGLAGQEECRSKFRDETDWACPEAQTPLESVMETDPLDRIQNNGEDGTQKLDLAEGRPAENDCIITHSTTRSDLASSENVSPSKDGSVSGKTPLRIRGQHRIQKAKSPAKNTRLRSSYQQTVTRGASATHTEPTMEDLLYLLMSRARQIRDTDSQIRADLEKQNKSLQSANASLQTALESAASEKDKLMSEVTHNQDELDNFKTRYKKIKAWALEMNAEHAALRQNGSKLKTSLKELQKQHTDVWKPVEAHIQQSSEALVTAARVKEDLASTKESVVKLKSSLHLAEDRLKEKCAELRILETVEQQHKAVLEELLKSHKRIQEDNTLRQEELSTKFQELAKSLQSERFDSSHANTLNECLHTVREISKFGPESSTKLKELASGMNQLKQNMQSVHGLVKHGVKHIEKSDKSSLLLHNITNVAQNIKQLRSEAAMSYELQDISSRHDDMFEGFEELRRMFTQAEGLAKTSRTNLHDKTEVLLEKVTAERENLTSLLSTLVEDVGKKLDDVVTRKDSAATEIGELQAEIKSHKSTVDELRHRLKETVHHHDSELARLCTKHEKDIKDRDHQSRKKQDEITTIWQTEVEEKERKIISAETALREEQNMLAVAVRKADQLTHSNQELELKIRCTEISLLTVTTNAAQEKRNLEDLTTKYKAMETTAGIIPVLEDDIRQKSAIIEKLKADVKALQALEKKLASAQADATARRDDIAELRAQLEIAREAAGLVDGLNEQIAQSQQNIHAINIKLTASELKSGCVGRLETEAKERQSEIVKIQSLLEDAQHRCRKIPKLESDKRQLQLQVTNLEEELCNEMERAKLALDLERELSTKDETITAQKEQITEFEQGQIDLESLQQQIRQRDATIALQADEIARLKIQSATLGKPHEESLNDDLEGIFSQSTNLSIDGPDWQSSQSTQASHVSAAGDNRDPVVSQEEGVDPRVIMKVTQPGSVLPAQGRAIPISQDIVIPETQPGLEPKAYDTSQDDSQKQESRLRTSSPLSDVDEYCLEHDPYEDDSDRIQSPRKQDKHGNSRSTGKGSTIVPRKSRDRFDAEHTNRRRPASAISQDEMLLQGSETRRQVTPRAKPASHINSGSGFKSSQSNSQVLTERSAFPRSRSRRSEWDIQTHGRENSPDVLASDPINQTVQAESRERNQPNSAIKRRIDHTVAPESSGREDSKRLKRANGQLRNLLSSNQQTHSATQPDDLPIRSRSGGSSVSGASASGTSSRKSRASRKSAKRDRYTAQFNNSERHN